MALLVARALARLLALALTIALAVTGLAVAVFSLQGDSSTLSPASLAGHARLDDLLGGVGVSLAALRADGPIAKLAALAGAGAILLGLLLLFGVFGRRRERLIIVRSNDDGTIGTIGARPRAIGQAAVTLGEQSPDGPKVKARTIVRRRGRDGRLRLTVYHAESTSPAEAADASRARVHALAESFCLTCRIRDRAQRRAKRVG